VAAKTKSSQIGVFAHSANPEQARNLKIMAASTTDCCADFVAVATATSQTVRYDGIALHHCT